VKSDRPERCGTCSCDSSDGCLSQSSVARLSDSGLLHTNSAWIAKAPTSSGSSNEAVSVRRWMMSWRSRDRPPADGRVPLGKVSVVI